MDKRELFYTYLQKTVQITHKKPVFFSSETHKYKTQQNLKFINTKPNNI